MCVWLLLAGLMWSEQAGLVPELSSQDEQAMAQLTFAVQPSKAASVAGTLSVPSHLSNQALSVPSIPTRSIRSDDSIRHRNPRLGLRFLILSILRI